MKFNETTFFVFIAAVIIGLLISLNIDLKGETSTILLSANQYADSYNMRTKLHKEISNLKEEYYKKSEKLDKYKNNDTENIIEDISNELKKNSMLIGSEAVIGKGIKITMNDASGEFDNYIDDPMSKWFRLIHNTDMMIVITGLRNAGAEAISINGERLLNNSEVYCSGPFLSINKVKLTAPFYINVIGKPDVISNYIMGEAGYLKFLKEVRKIQVTVEQSDEIKVPAYIGDVKYRYMSVSNK